MAEPKTTDEAERAFEKPGNGFAQKITEELRRHASLVADLLTIKMNNLNPWYKTDRRLLANAVEEIMYSDRVRVGMKVVLNHVSAKEAINAPTTIQLAVERGGETVLLNRDTPSAADVSVDWDGQHIMSEGDRVKVSFFVGTATNEIDFSASGYEIKA